MNLTEGADSKYEGRKASLIVTAPDNIPVDTMLTVQDTVYYLNSEKQYIISLGDIKNQTGSLTMNIFSNTSCTLLYSSNSSLIVTSLVSLS